MIVSPDQWKRLRRRMEDLGEKIDEMERAADKLNSIKYQVDEHWSDLREEMVSIGNQPASAPPPDDDDDDEEEEDDE